MLDSVDYVSPMRPFYCRAYRGPDDVEAISFKTSEKHICKYKYIGLVKG